MVGRVGRPKKVVKLDVAPVYLRQFEGKAEVDVRAGLQWVFENVDVGDVTPEMAPSAGAWSLRECIRQNNEFRLDFYKTVWPKLLPSRSQLEAVERYKDNGHETLRELIDLVADSLGEGTAPDGAEGAAGEFSISP